MPIMRVVIRGQAFGQDTATIRYFDAPAIPASFQQFANVFGSSMVTNWVPAAHDNVTLNDLYISEAVPGSLGVAVTPDSWPIEGLVPGDEALPPQNAVLMVYGGAGLSYPRQNRNRLTGVSESQVTSGILNSSGISAWTAVMNVITGTFFDGVNNWVGCLWSDKTQTAKPITVRTVRTQISSQDSRRVGVGG